MLASSQASHTACCRERSVDFPRQSSANAETHGLGATFRSARCDTGLSATRAACRTSASISSRTAARRWSASAANSSRAIETRLVFSAPAALRRRPASGDCLAKRTSSDRSASLIPSNSGLRLGFRLRRRRRLLARRASEGRAVIDGVGSRRPCGHRQPPWPRPLDPRPRVGLTVSRVPQHRPSGWNATADRLARAKGRAEASGWRHVAWHAGTRGSTVDSVVVCRSQFGWPAAFRFGSWIAPR